MTKDEMITKHCKNCMSTNLQHTVDLFKKLSDKDFYTGDVTCNDCNLEFKDTEIVIKKWIPLQKHEHAMQQQENTRLIRDKMIARICKAFNIESQKLKDIEKEVIAKLK